jgi:hypothetical protein
MYSSLKQWTKAFFNNITLTLSIREVQEVNAVLKLPPSRNNMLNIYLRIALMLKNL